MKTHLLAILPGIMSQSHFLRNKNSTELKKICNNCSYMLSQWNKPLSMNVNLFLCLEFELI